LLEPYHRHVIKVLLYPHETDNLEVVAQDLVKDGKSKAALLTGGSVSPTQFLDPSFFEGPVSQDFYLQVRRALIHPSCNPGYPWKNPQMLEEWSQEPS